MNVLRRALLAASTNAWLRDRATRSAFVRRSVRRFMPGEHAEDALTAAAALKPVGITTILTALGENLRTHAEAEQVTTHYLNLLDLVAASGLDAHISVKPTQLGLDLDRGMCESNLQRLVERAAQRGTLLWIDMESSSYVDRTLELYVDLRRNSPHVGVALQAYLYRTAKDLEALLPLGPAIRIVKGAYLEAPEVAYPDKRDVDENYYRLCVRALSPDARLPGALLHIATHDGSLADRLRAYARVHQVPSSAYEVAMLYGIGVAQQNRLAAEGERVRVLISYGEYWFPWYMRRLAERPANIWFVVKQMTA